MDRGERGTVVPALQTVENPTGRSGASIAWQTVPDGLTRPGLYLLLSLNHLKHVTLGDHFISYNQYYCILQETNYGQTGFFSQV